MAYLGYKMESEELRRATKEGWRVRFMGKVLLCRVFEINVSFTKQFTYCIREVKWFAKHLLFQKWIFSAPEIWGLVESLAFDIFTLNRIQK